MKKFALIALTAMTLLSACSEIMELFATDDFTCDDKLSGEFLLGYHCQKMEIARRIAELSANKSKTHE